MQISRPTPDEHVAYHNDYISRVPINADMDALLSSQPLLLRLMLRDVSDSAASAPRAPGEWTIKQILGHISDTERVFSFRALCLARGEKQPLHGFEQADYEAQSNSNTRSLPSLLAEFDAVRAASLALVRGLPASTHTIIGTVSGSPLSVRAILHILPGHVAFHLDDLAANYGLKR